MARPVGKREKPAKHKGLKFILKLILAIILILAAYVAYAFITYYRIDDNVNLDITNADGLDKVVATDENLTLQGWNIGFAAYLQDFSFFMDGGEESRARSEQAIYDNMDDIIDKLKEFDADFYTIQEVDIDSTRSYHVDERKLISDKLTQYSSTFAQNYDSPYLFWPLIKPHGASKAGLLSLSRYEMTSSVRRSLPIQTGFAKFIDLDRCYNVTRYTTDNGKELVVINLHLSAYTTDDTIVDQQLDMIYKQIQEELNKGNYIVCEGDFNMDILGNSDEVFGNKESRSWTQPFKTENLPEGFTLVNAYDESNPAPTCRDCDMGYEKGKSYVATVDGFIVSNNVEVIRAEVNDVQFKYSDHNPVRLTFKLKR